MASQAANRKKFKGCFTSCRPKLAAGKTFGRCMSSCMGGKRKKAKKSRRKGRRHKKLSPGGRYSAGKSRSIKVRVTVNRQATTAGEYSTPYAFQACVHLKGGGRCGYGKNPRKAIANAMSETAKVLRKRGGAFAGKK
jgi:hypothetical protein